LRFGAAGRFELQPARRRLLVDGTPARLGSRAFDLLAVLAVEPERTLPRDELLDRVWPGLVVEPNNLEVQVWALRRVIGPDAIATIPGRGYRFTLPVQAGRWARRDLAAPADDAHVLPTVAAALGVPLGASDPQQALAATVALLQVVALDNADAVPLGVASTVHALLARALPLQVRVVATSQVPLRIAAAARVPAVLGLCRQRVSRAGRGRRLRADLDCWALVQAMDDLMARSLLVVAGDMPPRHRLLQAPLALAREHLAASSEQAALRERHVRAVARRFIDRAAAALAAVHRRCPGARGRAGPGQRARRDGLVARERCRSGGRAGARAG
jgi:DNA-binding winged helix-turn-helix (wHTH) protein